jgi:hypothetical protein
MQLSIHRIWYLFKMQWVENRKLYLLGLLAMVGIIAIFFFTGSESENAQSAFFEIGLLLSSAIFTSTILSRFSDKNKAVSSLMLPVSALEKTTVAIIYSMVLFPLVYIVLIYPVVVSAHYFHTEVQGDLAPLWDYRTEEKPQALIMIYFILQAFTLFCSAIFRRFTFVKTAVLVCAVVFGTVLLNQKIQDQLYKNQLQPQVLPKGFVPNPPNYATEISTKIIYPPKGSKDKPQTVTSAPKKILMPTKNFHVAGGSAFMGVQFYAITYAEVHNPHVWTAVLPAWQQAVFSLLFYMVVPFFLLLTCLRLKEKTLI